MDQTFSTPHEITARMMTEEEGRKRVDSINRGINNIRVQLLDFRDREGWKALGYASWRECAVKEFHQSQTYLYYQLQAAEIEERIKGEENSTIVEKSEPIPESHLRPLAAIPPEDQPTVYHLAKESAPSGKLTAAHVSRTVREVTTKKRREEEGSPGRPHKPTSAGSSPALATNTTDAMLLATAAIEALERIPKNDPQRKAAIAKVATWCWQQNQPGAME